MKASKIVQQERPRINVPRSQALGYAQDVVNRAESVSLLLSMAILADPYGMTEGEKRDYLCHIRQLADEAKEAGDKLLYIVTTMYDQQEPSQEAANHG